MKPTIVVFAFACCLEKKDIKIYFRAAALCHIISHHFDEDDEK